MRTLADGVASGVDLVDEGADPLDGLGLPDKPDVWKPTRLAELYRALARAEQVRFEGGDERGPWLQAIEVCDADGDVFLRGYARWRLATWSLKNDERADAVVLLESAHTFMAGLPHAPLTEEIVVLARHRANQARS